MFSVHKILEYVHYQMLTIMFLIVFAGGEMSGTFTKDEGVGTSLHQTDSSTNTQLIMQVVF